MPYRWESVKDRVRSLHVLPRQGVELSGVLLRGSGS